MDNFFLNVRSQSRESFEHAMRIAFIRGTELRAKRWVVHPEYGMVLFWTDEEKDFQGMETTAFPYPLDAEKAADFIWNWIREEADRTDFRLSDMDRHYRDHDVSCEPAFRVYTEKWGKVGDDYTAIVAVLPCWGWYGK